MLYSTSQAAKAAGVSPATLRNLTTGRFASHYAGLLSPGAAPGQGTPRVFTAEDVTLLRYIRARTGTGASHADIAAEVRAGAMSSFVWSEEAPTPEPEEAPRGADRQPQGQPEAPTGAALVVLGQFTEALRVEFAAARQREADLQAALIAAEVRAAQAEAQLAALRDARRPWWSRLFRG